MTYVKKNKYFCEKCGRHHFEDTITGTRHYPYSHNEWTEYLERITNFDRTTLISSLLSEAKLRDQLTLKLEALVSEEWKWIYAYRTRYMVSTAGRVMSLVNKQPKMLHIHNHSSGHSSIQLLGRKRRSLTDLVLNTFKVKPKVKTWIRHLNGNPSDNRLENLTWEEVKPPQKKDGIPNSKSSSQVNLDGWNL